MLKIYQQDDQTKIQETEINSSNSHLLENALWIDLLSPTQEEEKLVEQYLTLEVPSKTEMHAIELSSRLYTENHAIFMTGMMLANSTSPEPKNDAVTFILTAKKLITIRYIQPKAFDIFIKNMNKSNDKPYDAETLFISLLETTVDRLSDLLEDITAQIDLLSQTIFHPKKSKKKSKPINYKNLFQEIGKNGDLGTKARESLVSFNRIISYFERIKGNKLDSDRRAQLEIISKDIEALNDHATFISTKVNFLLDATLGMVNIEQSNIIKIFSVAAVIFLPPTLVASIYGMNFIKIPELQWAYGYPFAIGIMLLSAWLPYRYFKKRKWL